MQNISVFSGPIAAFKWAIAAVLLMAPVPAFGQNWVEQRTDVSRVFTSARFDGWFSVPVKASVEGVMWFQVSETYSESWAGVSVPVTSWLDIGGGAGIESDQSRVRIAAAVSAGGARGRMITVIEGLGSGLWYKSEANVRVTSRLGVGVMTERFKGTGPRLQYALPGGRALLWAAFLATGHASRAVFGLRLKL